jgi:hypothetical protein
MGMKSLMLLIVVLLMVAQTFCKAESSDVSHGKMKI